MTKNNLTSPAKELRKNSTIAENTIWKHLRQKQLEGLKFKRQQPIDNYIVDFVCFERRVIIEVDGGQHSIEVEKDRIRDNYLRMNGFKVLRFWNNEVLENIIGVLEVIRDSCLNSPSPQSPPARGGEE